MEKEGDKRQKTRDKKRRREGRKAAATHGFRRQKMRWARQTGERENRNTRLDTHVHFLLYVRASLAADRCRQGTESAALHAAKLGKLKMKMQSKVQRRKEWARERKRRREGRDVVKLRFSQLLDRH